MRSTTLSVRMLPLAAALLLSCTAEPFRWVPRDADSLELREGERPVLVYRHGIIRPPSGMAADRARSSYIHPLYGPDGEVLSDDFPADHPHHRGLFWAWPHVRVDGRHHDLWMLRGIAHRHLRWLRRGAGTNGAVLGVENGWFVGDRQVMREEVWIRASPSDAGGRVLDVDLGWQALDGPVALQGAEDKSYGGLSLRFAPREDTVVTTPDGQGGEDRTMARMPWADLSARFDGRSTASGVAILVDPAHPDFPPEWLTRHYGVLCVGWPGVRETVVEPGGTVRCRYRLRIHRGGVDPEAMERLAAAYRIDGAWRGGAATVRSVDVDPMATEAAGD